MKLIQKHSRLLQIKEGNKIIFEILLSRKKDKFNSFKHGLGICSDCQSLSECIENTFNKIEYMNKELAKRLVVI